MKHKKDWGPGYRLFKCDDCGRAWKSKSRDCTSYSGEPCTNLDCDTGNFGFLVPPHGYEPHYEWPTDKSGNLVKE